MIEDIRKEIGSNINKPVIIKISIGRNKWEVYEGVIEHAYSNIFTIKIKDTIKSFTYSDVIIKDVLIKYV